MKWDECFVEICKSLFKITVTSSLGIRKGTGFVIANYTIKDKLDLVVATAKHLLDELPEFGKVYYKLENYGPRGNLLNIIEFETYIEKNKSGIRTNNLYDIGMLVTPYFEKGKVYDNLNSIVDSLAVAPGARVGWAGFPEFVLGKTIDSHPCYFEGVISATIERDGCLFYLVDGHGGQGVSGGPLWYWNDDTQDYEIIGICSQYLFASNIQDKTPPGMVIFESINPLIAYLKLSKDLKLNITS